MDESSPFRDGPIGFTTCFDLRRRAGSRSIEQLFDELLRFSTSLDDEQVRHVREQLTEEELVIFDILTRPSPELSSAERAEVKKVARELLAKLKDLLVLNWRHKASARSSLRLAIEDTLDSAPSPSAPSGGWQCDGPGRARMVTDISAIMLIFAATARTERPELKCRC